MLRFGQPVHDLIGEPGLYVKWPFIDSVVYIDRRILALDNEREEVIVAENQRLEVDAFVRYRIADPLRFYQSVQRPGRGLAARRHAEFGAAPHLSEASIIDIVRNRRDALMTDTHKVTARRRALRHRRRRRAHQARRPAGREFRGGVPPHAGRAPAGAAQFRAEGLPAEPEDQGRGRAQGDGDGREAQQQAEQTRGEGDAERNRIFAEAYGKDPEFFAFYRSMQAYDAGLKRRYAGDPESEVRLLPLFLDADADLRRPPPKRARLPPRRIEMRDFGAALGLVFAIEGMLMAAFTESMRARMASVAREDPRRLRVVGARRARIGRRDRLGRARSCCEAPWRRARRFGKTRDVEEVMTESQARRSIRSQRSGSALALALVAALAGAPLVLSAPAPAFAQARPTNLADLVDCVAEAVVNISATQTFEEKSAEAPAELPKGTPFDDMFEEFFRNRGQNAPPRPHKSQSLGSGFVIDPSGIVITNNHVIGEANDIVVIFTDGRKLKAEVIGKDPKVDVAVLKVKPTPR